MAAPVDKAADIWAVEIEDIKRGGFTMLRGRIGPLPLMDNHQCIAENVKVPNECWEIMRTTVGKNIVLGVYNLPTYPHFSRIIHGRPCLVIDKYALRDAGQVAFACHLLNASYTGLLVENPDGSIQYKGEEYAQEICASEAWFDRPWIIDAYREQHKHTDTDKSFEEWLTIEDAKITFGLVDQMEDIKQKLTDVESITAYNLTYTKGLDSIIGRELAVKTDIRHDVDMAALRNDIIDRAVETICSSIHLIEDHAAERTYHGQVRAVLDEYADDLDYVCATSTGLGERVDVKDTTFLYVFVHTEDNHDLPF